MKMARHKSDFHRVLSVLLVILILASCLDSGMAFFVYNQSSQYASQVHPSQADIAASQAASGLKDLYFGGIFPMRGGTWDGGQGCLPATMLGLDDVNNRTDILPGYNLRMLWNDSMVSASKIFLNLFFSFSLLF